MDRTFGSVLSALVLAASFAAFGCGSGSSGDPDAYVPECTSPNHCPGTDTTCEQRACTQGTCGMTSAAPGTSCTEDGGNVCDGAGSCVECVDHEDCAEGYMCDTGASMCVPPECMNEVLDGEETDVDCGGPNCAPCAVGADCLEARDCESRHCAEDGEDLVCATCADDQDCEDGRYCDDGDTGFCLVEIEQGEACGRDGECETGYCADGVCCDMACDGVCMACDLEGSEGDCTLHAAGTDPDDECGADVCSGAASCRCNDGAHNGQETDQDCGGPVCAPCSIGGACEEFSDCETGFCEDDDGDKECAACADHGDCQASAYCGGAGNCVPKGEQGASCDEDFQCADDACVDTYCCDEACEGICQGCNVAGAEGTCAPHPEGTTGECGDDVCSGLVAGCRCDDGEVNGDETDTDCGGPVCDQCEVGKVCEENSDCETGICDNLVCAYPYVVSVSPDDNAGSVPVATSIAITFNTAMDPATLGVKTILDAGACSGTIQVSTDDFTTCIPFAASEPAMSEGGTVATLTPAPGLAFGSTFRLRITTDAQATGGTALQDEDEQTPTGFGFSTPNGFTTELPTSACHASVVISQVYGGGGNATAPYRHDFVELHNRGGVPVNLEGWSVQYASSAGTSWQVTPLTGEVAPGGFYLVWQASQSMTGELLPEADDEGTIPMSATSGKVALLQSTTQLSVGCPLDNIDLVDFVGFGTANCYEGTGATGTLSNVNSAKRRDFGCTDTDDNSEDFTVGRVDDPPGPRNSSSPPVLCCVDVQNETGNPQEADFCNVQHPASITVQAGSPLPDLVYGRIYEAGITEDENESSLITAQFGFGPRDRNPQWESGWTFVAVDFNDEYERNGREDHEYETTPDTTAPADAGPYGYVYRFSLDGGGSWTYCDLNGAGSGDGFSFETTRIPLLTVTE